MSLRKLNSKKINLSQAIHRNNHNRGEEDEAYDDLLESVLNEYSSAFSQRVETCMKVGELLRAKRVFYMDGLILVPKR